jgi:transmembrane sensor
MISEVLNLQTLRGLSPEDAAATLQARRTEQPSSVPEQLIADWLQLDLANQRAWDLALRLDAALDAAVDNELLEAMRRHAREQTVKRPLPIAWLAAGIACAVVSLVVAAFIVETRPVPDAIVARSEALTYATGGASTFRTAPDQESAYRLADGSQLTLDSDSVVTVAFEKDRRRLRLLKGRAFFEVAHQPTRPFTVIAGDREVTAVGTQFDVRLGVNEVQVVLVEGRVTVGRTGAGDLPVLLLAGQQLTAAPGRRPTVGPANVQESLAWQHPSVTFRDEALDVVVAAINRGSAEQLVIRDPKVARMRVTGNFRTGDAARFGRTLAQAYPVRVVRLGPGQLEIRSIR